MRRTFIAAMVLAVVAALSFPATGYAKPGGAHALRGPGSDTFDPGPDVQGKIFTRAGAPVVPTANRAEVGDVRTWLGLDDTEGFYPKSYQLRAVGDHVEVWTATGTSTFAGITSTDLNFQDGDCRNGVRTTVTDQKVDYLVDQFDNNIYPTESQLFSVPPDRNGFKARATKVFHVSSNYYRGDGDDIVALIDNVRDDNFKDLNNSKGFSYIAGFFSSGLNGFFNRNIMTIDAFDWLHRTGANPPNEPVPGDNCASAPARPFLYEGVFAHEYQHLLLSYVDPAETTWQNEGLSDTAIALTGYGDPAAPITDLHFDSHIQCFQGYNSVQTAANPNPRPGGPENSLTLWGDQVFDHEQEILCDYGAAYSFLLWLADTYGDEVLTRLHNDAANGGDFVRLMDGAGAFLAAGGVTSVEFQGVPDLPPLPIAWEVDATPPSGADGPALHSPVGDNLNEVIVRDVSVPAGSPQLTFHAAWDLETTFDFGYAQITTDGGETYTSLQCTDTVDDTDPNLGNVGPGFGQGFNGENDPAVFAPQTCDLTPYAGQTVGLAFRVFNDGGVHFHGFWVDNVAIDGTVISDGSTLDGWQSATQYNPIEVEGYTVQLVAYDDPGHTEAHVFSIPIDASFHGELTGADVTAAIGSTANVVSAIVTYHDRTEQVAQYAPYALSVNGVTQPGG